MQPADYARIEKAILYLEKNFRRQPGLGEVARTAGLSEYHFHRLFTRWAGISPKRFLQFLTAEYARRLLRESPNVLDAAYEAGLSGPGRLHDLIVNIYAVTPGELKEEGAGLTIRYGVHSSPFGECIVAVTERGVCGLSFLSAGRADEALRDLRNRWGRATLRDNPRATKAIADRIFDPSRGRDSPPGCALTYENIAVGVGSPRAVRAVGSAVARNPVGFLIPCHRVLRKTGAFGDYHWGAARKKAILAWEAAKFRDPSET